jgi:hypothetical protein
MFLKANYSQRGLETLCFRGGIIVAALNAPFCGGIFGLVLAFIFCVGLAHAKGC